MTALDLSRLDARLDRTDDRQDRQNDRLARVEERLASHDLQLSKLSDVADTVVRLEARFDGLREDLTEYAKQNKEDREATAQREAQREEQAVSDRRDRRQTRQWMIGLVVAVLLGLLAATVTILASAPH